MNVDCPPPSFWYLQLRTALSRAALHEVHYNGVPVCVTAFVYQNLVLSEADALLNKTLVLLASAESLFGFDRYPIRRWKGDFPVNKTGCGGIYALLLRLLWVSNLMGPTWPGGASWLVLITSSVCSIEGQLKGSCSWVARQWMPWN